MIKTTKWSILFNQNPRRNHQTETLSLDSGQRVSALVISSGFWLNRIPSECGFYHYPVISCIYSFMGNYTCVHIAIYLRFFTSVILCLNVHLNCVSLDNHLVSNHNGNVILQWHDNGVMWPNKVWIFWQCILTVSMSTSCCWYIIFNLSGQNTVSNKCHIVIQISIL